MSKSIKLKDNTYIDSTGVVHNRTLLSTLLSALITDTQTNTTDIANLKNAHKRVQIFSGTVNTGDTITINTTWQEIGVFKDLIVQIKYSSWNEISNCRFNYNDLSTGASLKNGARNSNVYSSIGFAGGSNVSLHLVPASNIGNNTIKFTSGNTSITGIWVEY